MPRDKTFLPRRPRFSNLLAKLTASELSSSGEWRTSRTDTLWEIALRSRPSVRLYTRTMLAISGALNPNASFYNNINR